MTQIEINALLDKWELNYKSLFVCIDGELYFSKNSCLSNLCNSKLLVDEYDMGGIILIYSKNYASQKRSNDSVLLVLKKEPQVSNITFIDNIDLTMALTDEVLSELYLLNFNASMIIGNEMETSEIDLISAHRRTTIKNIVK